MTKYLLAAEADKIQDLLFRSSHLREVVGGSQMLTAFCQRTGRSLAEEYSGEWIISEGGCFRVMFDAPETARQYGDVLAEKYRQALGGTLTVAVPEPVDEPIEQYFRLANQKAHESLRKAKQHQPRHISTSHNPFIAFCTSCGIGLSTDYVKIVPQQERGQYICAHCGEKAKTWRENRLTDFLGPFYKTLSLNPIFDNIPVAEDIGKLDPRNYVAYLLADGNNMGKLFSQCNMPDDIKHLSENLPEILRRSLSKPTEALIARLTAENLQGKGAAVLPLIMGGDDLFVLIPSRWALDFAYQFTRAYEEYAQSMIKEINIDAAMLPTISIAVIICKAKYPYYLAHQRGEELLRRAKLITKRLAFERMDPYQVRSVINFDVILGSRLAGEEYEEGDCRPTLKPFWLQEDVANWGIAFHRLLAYRLDLRKLPHKRLAEFNELFDKLREVSSREDSRTKWIGKLEKLMERILKISDQNDRMIKKAVQDLGGEKLYEVQRQTDDEVWYGHALPDLLSAWDYAYKLDVPLSEYEE